MERKTERINRWRHQEKEEEKKRRKREWRQKP